MKKELIDRCRNRTAERCQPQGAFVSKPWEELVHVVSAFSSNILPHGIVLVRLHIDCNIFWFV